MVSPCLPCVGWPRTGGSSLNICSVIRLTASRNCFFKNSNTIQLVMTLHQSIIFSLKCQAVSHSEHTVLCHNLQDYYLLLIQSIICIKYAQSNLNAARDIWDIFLCYSGTVLRKIHSMVIITVFHFLMFFRMSN